MGSFTAIIPIANMQAANDALAAQGFGGRNFSVPCYGATGVTHAVMHSWDAASFIAAVKAIPQAIWDESAGDPISKTAAVVAARGAVWGDQSPVLPESGNVTAGQMYRRQGVLWIVIQTHSRSTYGGDPAQYASLMRVVRDPYTPAAWRQPIDGFDAYKLVNPFTGRADEALHSGKRWIVTQADGSGNNVWAPGVFGWAEV